MRTGRQRMTPDAEARSTKPAPTSPAPSHRSNARQPGPARDRREIRLRLRRGFLASAAEGTASPQAAADFERCLQLAGTDLRESELFATLTALWAYYLPRGDLRRTLQVSESMRAKISVDQSLVSPRERRRRSALSPGTAGISPTPRAARRSHGSAGSREHSPITTRRGLFPMSRSRRRIRTWRWRGSSKAISEAPRSSSPSRPSCGAARLPARAVQPCLSNAATRSGCASRPASSTVPPTVAEQLTSRGKTARFRFLGR